MKRGESYFLYSTRLEKLYKMAYPRHDPNKSKTLVKQYKASVSNSMKQIISSQSMFYKMKDKAVDWQLIKKCAQIRDADEDGETESSTEKNKEIVINLSKDYNNELMQRQPRQKFREERWARRPTRQLYDRNRPRNYKEEQFNEEQRKGKQNNGRNDGWDNKNKTASWNRFGKNSVPTLNLERVCNICGRFGHTKDKCRIWLRTCLICGGEDHFKRHCPRNYRNQNGCNFQYRLQSNYRGQSSPAQVRSTSQSYQKVHQNNYRPKRNYSEQRLQDYIAPSRSREQPEENGERNLNE